ncbi:hypothetical protein GY12_11135 [Micrococcus luteus]|nr:hypothetical protein GY12_11135 [Micrococcus luteus]
MAREYSDCTAAIGWTATARVRVAAETSDRPIAPILPSVTASASAPTDSSTGTSGSSRCR